MKWILFWWYPMASRSCSWHQTKEFLFSCLSVSICLNTWWGGVVEHKRIISVILSDRRGNRHRWKYRNFHFLLGNGQTLKQIAQRGCGVFMLRDIQNPDGHNPEQPAPADPALSRGLGRRSPEVSSSTFLWFCAHRNTSFPVPSQFTFLYPDRATIFFKSRLCLWGVNFHSVDDI